MTGPFDRLRAADPAASLPPQPDDRAERDLALLLAEPAVPSGPAAAPTRRVRAPFLVTAVVAALVVAVTGAVLGVVRPGVQEAAPAPTTSVTPTLDAVAPPYVVEECRPLAVRPFACGTYRSTYGPASVTGDGGGPEEDPLSISFTPLPQPGVLLLNARSDDGCFAAALPVRYEGGTLVPAGDPLFGTGSDCASGRADPGHWGHVFLARVHRVAPGNPIVFDGGAAMVTFEYQGAAALGRPQWPRDDLHGCVAAHVLPFSCGDYRAVEGTGSVAFLADDPYRLSFLHLDGELTASFLGRCNALSATVQPDGATLVVGGGGQTQMLCRGDRGTHDAAVSAFFDGVLTFRIDGDAVTFTKGSSSATFRRG